MRLSTVSCLLAAVAYPLGVAAANIDFPVLTANAASDFAASKGPIPPSKDPFYKAPAGFEKKPVGTILRHRPVPHPLLVGPALDTGNVKHAYQLLYRTTSGRGNPQAAMQTVIIPHNATMTNVLAYSTFYDAADVNCSPSYTLQQGSPTTNVEGVIMSVALAQGWIVTVSDYEGPQAAFTVGHQAGQALLDGIRATLGSTSISGIPKSAKVALFGYSGGALASEWAVELQPSYAKDLKLIGAAFGGLTPNVTNVILTVNNSPNSNLVPTGILGVASEYPSVSSFLHKSLIQKTKAEFRHPLMSCSSPKLSNKNIFKFFKQGAKSLESPLLKRVVSENGIMGKTNTPKVPLLIYKSTGDEVSPVADTDKLVKKYCAAGADIQYIRNHFGDHETEFIVGLPEAFDWIIARFAGKPVAKKCKTVNEKVSKLAPSSKKLLGDLVYQELKAELKSFSGGGK